MRAVLLALLLVIPALSAGRADVSGPILLDADEVLADGRLALPDGTVVLLEAPLDVRADGFRVVAQEGADEVVLDVAPHLHAGRLAGDAGSWAVVSVTPEGVLAVWAGSDGALGGVVPVAYARGGTADGRHALLDPPVEETIDDGGVAVPESAVGDAVAAPPAAERPARVMIDVDEPFWRFHSCVLVGVPCPPEAERFAVVAEHAIAVLDAVYARQTGVRLEVSEVHAWRSTDAPYPYDTSLFVHVESHLGHVQRYWEGVRPTTSDPRDALHLMSGRNADGTYLGVAFIAAIETSYAYAVSSTPTWSTRNYVLMAHELGHNFDGVHGESGISPLTWPVFSKGVPLWQGTIMAPIICNCWEFTDGSQPGKDNAARIRGHAGWRVQGP